MDRNGRIWLPIDHMPKDRILPNKWWSGSAQVSEVEVRLGHTLLTPEPKWTLSITHIFKMEKSQRSLMLHALTNMSWNPWTLKDLTTELLLMPTIRMEAKHVALWFRDPYKEAPNSGRKSEISYTSSCTCRCGLLLPANNFRDVTAGRGARAAPPNINGSAISTPHTPHPALDRWQAFVCLRQSLRNFHSSSKNEFPRQGESPLGYASFLLLLFWRVRRSSLPARNVLLKDSGTNLALDSLLALQHVV